jgi:hypothetical protein
VTDHEQDLADDEVLVDEVIVRQVLKADGSCVVRYRHSDGMAQSTIIGLLAFAQQAIFYDSMQED